MIKTETRGRKALPVGQHKPPQATVKVNEAILPLVKLLKGNLKKGLLTQPIISDLVKVANNEALPFKQTTMLDDKALAKQTELIEQLKAENLKLLLEKDVIVRNIQQKERKVLTLPKKISVAAGKIEPVKRGKTPAKCEESATAKTMKISMTLNPESIPRMDTIGKKLTRLLVKVQKTELSITLNSKSYRKAIAAIDAHGADACHVVIQGSMVSIGKIEQAGIQVIIKQVSGQEKNTDK
jgi:hypothetical protein